MADPGGRRLRIGVLGAGQIAQAAHLEACRKANNAELYALCEGLRLLSEADPRLARSRRLFVEACACQLAVILLDAATIWVLLLALGATAPPGGVFVSFMISTLFRLIGVAPGGLGIFEATSVLTLKMMGVALPIALSATLLFRGMSFWLPLVPGLWFSRRYMAYRRVPSRAASR